MDLIHVIMPDTPQTPAKKYLIFSHLFNSYFMTKITEMENKWPRSGKMNTYGDSLTKRLNILNSSIALCQNCTYPWGPLVPTRNAFAAVSWFKKKSPVESSQGFENNQMLASVSTVTGRFMERNCSAKLHDTSMTRPTLMTFRSWSSKSMSWMQK